MMCLMGTWIIEQKPEKLVFSGNQGNIYRMEKVLKVQNQTCPTFYICSPWPCVKISKALHEGNLIDWKEPAK